MKLENAFKVMENGMPTAVAMLRNIQAGDWKDATDEGEVFRANPLSEELEVDIGKVMLPYLINQLMLVTDDDAPRLMDWLGMKEETVEKYLRLRRDFEELKTHCGRVHAQEAEFREKLVEWQTRNNPIIQALAGALGKIPKEVQDKPPEMPEGLRETLEAHSVEHEKIHERVSAILFLPFKAID